MKISKELRQKMIDAAHEAASTRHRVHETNDELYVSLNKTKLDLREVTQMVDATIKVLNEE